MVSRNFAKDDLPISNTSNKHNTSNIYDTHKNQSHFVNVSLICDYFHILN